ncbi:phosphate ABC transporter permease subunit PstC [Caulobacter sp. KR2-114]|uniref:phosphate ABC transporter permease subunit PstC n=1 Tax=Caulobacter sp. KR2-114 TaxID=3400912 RepID=UPI003C032B87
MTQAALDANAAAPPRRASPKGAAFERAFEILCFSAATMLLATLGGVLISLILGGWPAFAKFGLGFFTTSTWDPVNDIYGAAGPIVGTIITAALALLLAVPVAFGIAFFLVELCPAALRRTISTAVELLAGIPSIIYGMWGLFIFAPLFSKYLELPLMTSAPPGSFMETLVQGTPGGSGILAASIILAIMILPFMAATLRELLLTVPAQVRESAYGLGATTQEVVMQVTLPYVRRGAVGAVMLGLGRALGETMAVTFIIGNSHAFPKGLFDSGSTISSTIANEFTEATSPLHTASLIALGVVLFMLTTIVLGLSRLMLRTSARV